MALIKWEPLRDIERLFDEEFSLLPSFSNLSKIGWDLAADVYEENGKVVAEMNLPGIDPDKVDISVEDGYLKVSGSREQEKETKGKNYYSKEIKRGSFERAVKLPSSVKSEKAEAEYKDGVLRVLLPKQEPIVENRIRIKVKK